MINEIDKIVAQNKQHLERLIAETINNYGNDCDLNFIDVFNVADMSKIFEGCPLKEKPPKWYKEE